MIWYHCYHMVWIILYDKYRFWTLLRRKAWQKKSYRCPVRINFIEGAIVWYVPIYSWYQKIWTSNTLPKLSGTYLFMYRILYRSDLRWNVLCYHVTNMFSIKLLYTGLYSNLQVLFSLCVSTQFWIVRLFFKLKRFNLISLKGLIWWVFVGDINVGGGQHPSTTSI